MVVVLLGRGRILTGGVGSVEWYTCTGVDRPTQLSVIKLITDDTGNCLDTLTLNTMVYYIKKYKRLFIYLVYNYLPPVPGTTLLVVLNYYLGGTQLTELTPNYFLFFAFFFACLSATFCNLLASRPFACFNSAFNKATKSFF